MQASRFRVVLVGAGSVADHHAAAVLDLDAVELAGFIDLDRSAAEAKAARFGTRTYDSLAQAVADKVNVAHVLTPPSSHAAVALEAIDLGLHVLVEKPLAESVEDCRALSHAASEKGVFITTNHSLLFDPEVQRAIRTVESGSIGKVLSMDVIRSSEYPSFAGGPLPPHYRDPGYPFRDLGVHGVYLMQRFLGEVRGVTPTFGALGGDPLLAYDDWRCLLDCAQGTGQIHLSWSTRPIQNLLLIQGSSGVMRVDLLNRFVSLRRDYKVPKAVQRVVNNLTDSVRPLIDTFKGIALHLLGRRRPFQGIHNFVGDFYERLGQGKPPAVTVEDAIPVVHFTEFVARQAEQSYQSWNDLHPPSPSCDVLVTGGTGRLGSAIVQALLADGKRVRVLARREPKEALPRNLEYIVGDLGDPCAVDRASAGATMLIHAGAAMSGSWAAYQCATIEGTRNVIDAARAHGLRRVVHISSLSVVDWAGSQKGPPVDEATPFEPQPDRRGNYTRSKLEAEHLVKAAAATGDLDVVILRPGQICGNGFPLLTGAVCRRLGPVNLVLGDGGLRLPLVHIDDVVAAVGQALEADIESGTVIQLVDPDRYTQNDILEICRPGGVTMRLPRTLTFGLGWMSEKALGVVGRQSPFSAYRLKSALARLEFESDAASRLLGWRPSVGVKGGLARWRRSSSQR